MRINTTKIVFTALFSLSILFAACSKEEAYVESKTEGEWTAAAPSGKLSIAVDEDIYAGLLKQTAEKPTSDIKITVGADKCFLEIKNKEFADFIYTPQNIELKSGESYFYTIINSSLTDTITAESPLVFNESFPLVTNIAYNFLKDIHIDQYTSKIDSILLSHGNAWILKCITKEGGIKIEQLGLTLNYTADMTLKEYLEQMGMFDIFVVKIIKNLAGEKSKDKVDAIVDQELSLALKDLMPILIENAKLLSINDFVNLVTKDLGDMESVAKGMIEPFLVKYLPKQMMDIPIGKVFENLISGVKYVQKNLKTAVVIKKISILPTVSTISLKKMKSDENSTALTNNMNFKFIDLQFSPLVDTNIEAQELAKYNQLLIPLLNTALPKLLSNAEMLPGEIGKKFGNVNDFNYIISSKLTKK